MKKWILVTVGSILFVYAFIWLDQLNAQISIPMSVILAGVIVFFIEKNGIQTRRKIEEGFDELYARLHKDAQEKKAREEEKFAFVHSPEEADLQTSGERAQDEP